MSTLRSAIEELAGEDLETVGDDAVETDLVEIHHAIEALEAQLLRRVATVGRRRSFERDGTLSTLRCSCTAVRMAGSTAREKVRVARAGAHEDRGEVGRTELPGAGNARGGRRRPGEGD